MRLFVIVLALIAAVSGTIPPPPTGDRPKPDQLYRISNFVTGQFIDHSSASPASGASIISTVGSPSDTQKWHARIHFSDPGQDQMCLQGLGQDDFISRPEWETGLLETTGACMGIVALPIPNVVERAYWLADSNPGNNFPEFTSAITGFDEGGSRLVTQTWNSSNKYQMWQFHLILDSAAAEPHPAGFQGPGWK